MSKPQISLTPANYQQRIPTFRNLSAVHTNHATEPNQKVAGDLLWDKCMSFRITTVCRVSPKRHFTMRP
ncbi:hypothetical protein J6590_065626 [Homalodisca vitripennis]|nr:hypothetical protein J6590_065626 [Homalodisca vitripennis]